MSDPHITVQDATLTVPATSLVDQFRKRLKGVGHQDTKSEFVILDQISVRIEKGESVGILGRNGAGKSTLLKLMAGIYYPTTGSVRTTGQMTAIFSLAVGSNYALTGRQNIELRGRLLGLNMREIREKEQEIIEFANLDEYIDMPLHTYSTGMALRLAFSTTTAVQSEILLMDEWIAAGDHEFRKKANQRIAAMTESAGIFVLASHNINILKQYCRRGIVLDKGKLQFDGTIEEALKFNLN